MLEEMKTMKTTPVLTNSRPEFKEIPKKLNRVTSKEPSLLLHTDEFFV